MEQCDTMERERITITIKHELLGQVDRLIDGTKVRNRSHAIESLVTKALGSQLGTAVILAGGEGVKMRPFTYEMPKPMIPVNDRPILEHLIERLKDHNIRRIILLTGYLGDKIQAHFGDGAKFGVQITYVHETKPLGTAGALVAAKQHLGTQPFFVFHGDVLADINLTDVAEFHQQYGRLATMSLTSVRDPEAYGAVRLSGTKIVKFEEKPDAAASVSRLINAGIYVLDPAVLDLVLQTQSTPTYLETDVFPQLVNQEQLTGYNFEGAWFDISTPTIYERALKEWEPA